MKKRKSTTVILVIIMLLGLSLLLYPSVSNWWNSFHSSQVVSSYSEAVQSISDEEYEEMWKQAVAYNKGMAKNGIPDYKSKEFKKRYNDLLNPAQTGMMGYIDIPKIDVTLPIYHGTDEYTLNSNVGHIEWSSLPVGGKSSHCVLSGHRGLPSAKLLTDIDQLKEGDIFILTVLNEMLTYEVDQIRVVLPDEVQDLQIEEGKDYCTLVTCTPYGVNTHRLLVRGHRIANIYDSRINNEAIRVDTLLVAGCIAVFILAFIIVAFLRRTKNRKVKEKIVQEAKK